MCGSPPSARVAHVVERHAVCRQIRFLNGRLQDDSRGSKRHPSTDPSPTRFGRCSWTRPNRLARVQHGHATHRQVPPRSFRPGRSSCLRSSSSRRTANASASCTAIEYGSPSRAATRATYGANATVPSTPHRWPRQFYIVHLCPHWLPGRRIHLLVRSLASNFFTILHDFSDDSHSVPSGLWYPRRVVGLFHAIPMVFAMTDVVSSELWLVHSVKFSVFFDLLQNNCCPHWPRDGYFVFRTERHGRERSPEVGGRFACVCCVHGDGPRVHDRTADHCQCLRRFYFEPDEQVRGKRR